MKEEIYKHKLRSEIVKALVKAMMETKEVFFVKEITFDKNTNEIVFKIEASDKFHNKAKTYL